MNGDAFQALCAQGGDFAAVAKKWKRKAYRSAKKIAAVLRISEDDALQEVLLNMWSAYSTYCKQQVRYEGGIWDVAVDGPRYTLQHPFSGERVEVPRWKAEPVDKRMSAASFVYLRMVQWQSNLFAVHYTARNGYEQAPEKIRLPNGKEKPTFVRVVFEEPFGRTVGHPLYCDEGTPLEELIDSHMQTPEDEVHTSEIVRLLWGKLDATARLVLAVYVSAQLPLPECPSGSTDTDYLAFVLGISVDEARASLKRVLKAMPKEMQAYEAATMKRDRYARSETIVRHRPVQELLGGNACG